MAVRRPVRALRTLCVAFTRYAAAACAGTAVVPVFCPSIAMMIGVRAVPRSMMIFTCPSGLLTQCRKASMEFSNRRAPSMLSTHESIPRRNFRVFWCCMQIFTRGICANCPAKDIQGKSQTSLPENGDSIVVRISSRMFDIPNRTRPRAIRRRRESEQLFPPARSPSQQTCETRPHRFAHLLPTL